MGASTKTNIGKSTADSNNDGMANYSAHKGQTIVVSYGKDGSSLKGSMEHERGKEMKNTGLSKSMKA
jgi:hypothetical protein